MSAGNPRKKCARVNLPWHANTSCYCPAHLSINNSLHGENKDPKVSLSMRRTLVRCSSRTLRPAMASHAALKADISRTSRILGVRVSGTVLRQNCCAALNGIAKWGEESDRPGRHLPRGGTRTVNKKIVLELNNWTHKYAQLPMTARAVMTQNGLKLASWNWIELEAVHSRSDTCFYYCYLNIIRYASRPARPPTDSNCSIYCWPKFLRLT